MRIRKIIVGLGAAAVFALVMVIVLRLAITLRIIPPHVLDLKSPLSGAVMRGDLAAVSNLIAAGADPNARDRWLFGWTPLIAATYFNHTDVMEYLLTLGVQVGTRDSIGETAFGYAITADDTNAARLLLEHGAAGYEDWDMRIPNLKQRPTWDRWLPLLQKYGIVDGTNSGCRSNSGVDFMESSEKVGIKGSLGSDDVSYLPRCVKNVVAFGAKAMHY